MNRCIPSLSVINNCVDYYNGIFPLCILCDEGFFLYNYLEPFECVEIQKFVEFCEVYSVFYECLDCINGYFLFSNLEDFKSCIKNSFFVFNCLDYDLESFECLSCEDNSFFRVVNSVKICIECNEDFFLYFDLFENKNYFTV